MATSVTVVVVFQGSFLAGVLSSVGFFNVAPFVPPGDVDPAARVISLGPVSDVVDSGVLQQLNESSGHISACRSKELRIQTWDRLGP